MPHEYIRRQSVELFGTFTDQNGQLVNPDMVTFTLRDPRGTVTPYTFPGGDGTITQLGTGRYHAILSPVLNGTYYYTWYGERGDLTPVDAGAFEVSAPAGL